MQASPDRPTEPPEADEAKAAAVPALSRLLDYYASPAESARDSPQGAGVQAALAGLIGAACMLFAVVFGGNALFNGRLVGLEGIQMLACALLALLGVAFAAVTVWHLMRPARQEPGPRRLDRLLGVVWVCAAVLWGVLALLVLASMVAYAASGGVMFGVPLTVLSVCVGLTCCAVHAARRRRATWSDSRERA